MQKSRRIVSLVLVLLLMSIFIIYSFNKSEDVVANEDDNGLYSVEVINANPSCGNVSIAYKEQDTYIDTNKTEYQVKSETKVKFYFKDGLNPSYEVYMWANSDNGILTPTMDSADQDQYYKSDKFILTINKNVKLYVFAKTQSEHVVKYYNSSVNDKRKLIGVEIVEDGVTASFKNFTIPKQSGFDFVKWSSDLSNVDSDIEVYPIYKSGVWSVFRDYYPMFLKGLGVTLLLSVVSVSLALLLGICLCFLRLSNVKILKFLSATYVEVIRGVPLLLQLLIIYVILGPTKVHFGNFFSTEVISCLLALFINSGAYSSEIFRSGIQAVDKGQMEAGRALGLSRSKTMIKVIIPQGIKNSLPSIGNELVSIIKETSLAVSVDASIGELMSVRKQITAATYINLPPYIVVAIIYFIVTFTLSKLIGLLEKRLEGHEH